MMTNLPDNLIGRLRAAEINSKTAIEKTIEQDIVINNQSNKIDKLEKQLLSIESQLASLRGMIISKMGSGATA